jgi:hypothetical protein
VRDNVIVVEAGAPLRECTAAICTPGSSVAIRGSRSRIAARSPLMASSTARRTASKSASTLAARDSMSDTLWSVVR